MKSPAAEIVHYDTAPYVWRERQAVQRLARLHTGQLQLSLPGGRDIVFRGERPGPRAAMQIRSLRSVTRLFTAGSIGFAEGYIAGDWECDDLPALIYLLHLNADALEPDFSQLHAVYRLLGRIRHAAARNSRAGSRRNIAYHYDLGNAFYARWLDETWTYSSALFERADEPLATAQHRKYARLLAKLAPAPGDHILEIGCGWGGFAHHAARHADVRVTGITLSTEQLRHARAMARAEHLENRIKFKLCDYRDIDESYDHVVSIEMYEAVGEAYWPRYFEAIAGALKPGGRAALQAITIDAGRFEVYRSKMDFIQKYIFPGGMLASPEIFEAHAARAGLRGHDKSFHGGDYARTLMRWDQSVRAAKAAIVASHGPAFYRMWRYYLAYCAAGFQSGNIDLMQIVFDKRRDD